MKESNVIAQCVDTFYDISKNHYFLKCARMFSQPVKLAMTSDVLNLNFSVPQENASAKKPKGLWYGYGGAWIDFVNDHMKEEFYRYNYIYQLTTNDSSLFSVTVEDKNYRILLNYFGKYDKQDAIVPQLINWQQLASEYCGIDFPPPYRRFAKNSAVPDWWSRIDLPSGCIWDGSCIIQAKQIGVRKGNEWVLESDEENVMTNDLYKEIDQDEFDRNILLIDQQLNKSPEQPKYEELEYEHDEDYLEIDKERIKKEELERIERFKKEELERLERLKKEQLERLISEKNRNDLERRRKINELKMRLENDLERRRKLEFEMRRRLDPSMRKRLGYR